MHFTKMHGLGNDYIFVDCHQERVQNPSTLAVSMSRPHIGVGSDGLILIRPSGKADFAMEMYNADGSLGEMCGNGIRCVGKFVYDKGLTKKEKLKIETASGVKELHLSIQNGVVRQVKVDMGPPELNPKRIPVNISDYIVFEMPLVVGESAYPVTCVSMGNPHAVLFLEEIASIDLETLGPQFERHPLFPNRINTEFVKIIDKSTLELRVWERGSGETKACGTGACAAVVAGVLTGRCDRAVQVHLPGGILDIIWDAKSGHVLMTGPAQTVFEGEWIDDEAQ